MSQIKRQWCAMLAKLVAPMEPERAARAFVDMLPMLPVDDAVYNRQTLDAAATCERRTAVPTYADLSKVLGRAGLERLPVSVRMGAKPSAPMLEPPRATAEERAAVSAMVRALTAELKAKFAARQI